MRDVEFGMLRSRNPTVTWVRRKDLLLEEDAIRMVRAVTTIKRDREHACCLKSLNLLSDSLENRDYLIHPSSGTRNPKNLPRLLFLHARGSRASSLQSGCRAAVRMDFIDLGKHD
jgi:hypothetical protein